MPGDYYFYWTLSCKRHLERPSRWRGGVSLQKVPSFDEIITYITLTTDLLDRYYIFRGEGKESISNVQIEETIKSTKTRDFILLLPNKQFWQNDDVHYSSPRQKRLKGGSWIRKDKGDSTAGVLGQGPLNARWLLFLFNTILREAPRTPEPKARRCVPTEGSIFWRNNHIYYPHVRSF